MRLVSGTFNGTGAAITVGCGFVPDFVKLWNLEVATNPVFVEWNKNMRSAEQFEGLIITNHATVQLARYTYGTGIAPYAGGDITTGASTAYLLPTADVIGQTNLARKGQTITSTISTWTSDTAANRTGSVDVAFNETYAGVGSIIRVWEPITRTIYEATIVAFTSDGTAANDITTSTLIPSGEVMYIGPMYDYIGAASAGVVVPEGFKLNMTTVLNVSGDMISFEAGQYLR